MRTQKNFRLKNLILVLALVGFALPSNARPVFHEIHYKHPHQYVYYPKQNFYYDPMFGQYMVVENGVWVRQPYPPRLLRKININILPHTDLYLTTMYPYHYNMEHRKSYRVMALLTPSTAFYAFRMPNRYDFSIGAYEYYYKPDVEVAFAEYNPNYYCHPYARPHRHHGPDRYNYLVVYATNDYHNYHGVNHPHGPGHHYYEREPRYAYWHGKPQHNPAPHGHGYGNYSYGNPNHSHYQSKPNPGKPQGPGKPHGNKNMNNPRPQQKAAVEPNNPPQPNNSPQEKKQPKGFHEKVNKTTAFAVHTMDKQNRNQDRNKVMHQKEVVFKHQVDHLQKEDSDNY